MVSQVLSGRGERPGKTSGATLLGAVVAVGVVVTLGAIFVPRAMAQEPGPPAAAPADPAPPTATVEPDREPQRENKNETKKPRRAEVRAAIAALDPKYRLWLEEVELLISEVERLAFLEIEQEYQRDAFIDRFWRARDPYPDSARNELRELWTSRLEEARENFGSLVEDRARYFLLNGPPTVRLEFTCSNVVYPLELWYYRRSEKVSYEFFILFVRRWGGQKFTLFRANDDPSDLFDFGAGKKGLQAVLRDIYTCRDGEIVAAGISKILRDPMEQDMLMARIEEPPVNPSPEWIATFAAYSTDLPEDASTFAAELEIAFPSRYQTRTVAEVTIEIDPPAAASASPAPSHNYFLTGEILQQGQLFENFRYRYDFPDGSLTPDQPILLQFERRLRPGSYRMVVKLEELNSQRVFRDERDIEVPRIEPAGASPAEAGDPETEKVLAEAAAAIGTDIPTVQIVEPRGEMQTGMVRFDTLTTGQGIVEMRFALNGRVVLQKRRAPYSVELDLGSVPRTHQLRVSAHDAEGRELASDELLLNSGRNSFEVRFLEPQPGGEHRDSVFAELDVATPEGTATERVELFLNETLLATLYQPPYGQRLPLPAAGDLAYIRAVAYLADGNSTEALVYINAPDYLEIVDIQYVELYTSALDKSGRPIAELDASELEVIEDGTPQTIRRFERVDNLPVHVQVMIDVSASMVEDLEQTRAAALEFFETSITPKDRAALITFNDHPYLAVDFTNDPKTLAGGLAGLKAERGTSLYDTLIFGLYYLNGVKGQRAILLLSDGRDETSRFSFEDTLDYARRAGVAIYVIGLDISGKDSATSRRKLAELALETGGASFFIKSSSELTAVYQQIQRELRSRYLVTYQSTNSGSGNDFRGVELRTSRPGVTLKTIRGYYP